MNSFEAWARSKELDLTKHPNKDQWGYDYFDINTQMFWECWQAAQPPDWITSAYVSLGHKRDKMSPNEVEAIQKFLERSGKPSFQWADPFR